MLAVCVCRVPCACAACVSVRCVGARSLPCVPRAVVRARCAGLRTYSSSAQPPTRAGLLASPRAPCRERSTRTVPRARARGSYRAVSGRGRRRRLPAARRTPPSAGWVNGVKWAAGSRPTGRMPVVAATGRVQAAGAGAGAAAHAPGRGQPPLQYARVPAPSPPPGGAAALRSAARTPVFPLPCTRAPAPAPPPCQCDGRAQAPCE